MAAFHGLVLVVVEVLELVEMVLGHADNDDVFRLSAQYIRVPLQLLTAQKLLEFYSTTKSEGPPFL
jgi:hypothetical protein